MQVKKHVTEYINVSKEQYILKGQSFWDMPANTLYSMNTSVCMHVCVSKGIRGCMQACIH